MSEVGHYNNYYYLYKINFHNTLKVKCFNFVCRNDLV